MLETILELIKISMMSPAKDLNGKLLQELV